MSDRPSGDDPPRDAGRRISDPRDDPPNRKHPVHGVIESLDGPTIVFDTVCTKDRAPTLASEEVHRVLREAWKSADAWRVGQYVVMPDHIHYFAANVNPMIEFDSWVRYWKSQFTQLFRFRFNRRSPVKWQTDHWDVTIRNWRAYDEKWEYVRNNSVRHGLIDRPDAWPYQGEIHRLRWE